MRIEIDESEGPGKKLGAGASSSADASGTDGKFYEMLWDCPTCGTKGLLGKTQRHCPSCGQSQDPERRYFPADGEEVEAKGHTFVGRDWECEYCHAPNGAAASFCCDCGGPKDGTHAVKTVDEVVPKEKKGGNVRFGDESVKASPSSRPSPVKDSDTGAKIFIGLGVLLLIGLSVLAFMFFSKHEGSATVTGKNWSRTISIDKFMMVRDSAWCDSMPFDAYMVSRSREVRSHDRVRDGEECHVEKKDKGDGTFMKNKVCSPTYRDVPVYDYRCSYSVNRWTPFRSVSAKGDGNTVPSWPQYMLAQGMLLGSERVSGKSESYSVSFKTSEEKSESCQVSRSRWDSLSPTQKLKILIRGIGGTDCSSVETPQG